MITLFGNADELFAVNVRTTFLETLFPLCAAWERV